jgi:Putative auto-transporter adhesin, head GIN domain
MNSLSRAALITPLLCAASWLTLLWPTATLAAEPATPGVITTETRTVPDFQAIALGGSMDLVVRQGPQQVQVTAGDKQLPQLETVVENGKNGPTLMVRWKREAGERGWSWKWNSNDWKASNRLRVTVSVPKLSALSASGSGDIVLEAFNTPALKLALSGSGDAKLNGLTTDELGISIAGSGDVQGTGSAAKLTISIAGSGDVRLNDLRADDVKVTIAGSGDAAVNAQKTLNVSIAGSGDVSYSGDAVVKSSVAGSGGVSKR